MSTQPQPAYRKIALGGIAPVRRITLANPPVNVIDVPMMEELARALSEIEQRDDISAIVITGSERVFSAGVDIAAHTPERVEEMLAKFHAVIRMLLNSKKVTIAAVWGKALGGGAELAMVCDLVYTARDATWGFPEIKLGCYPPVAAVGLAALIGQKRAAELILTGREISGDEAVAMGLANASAREEGVELLVADAVERLRQLSPTALAAAKKAFYAWDAIHFDKGLARAEDIYLGELMKTEDAAEGIRAWTERRPPVWKGN
jgi:cyclohexa-1,5-dienecarbonyl-CoA hydratase